MIEPAARLQVISRVKVVVTKRHFNIGNIDYGEWVKAVDEQTPALLELQDHAFEEGIRKLLAALRSSHTNFYRADTSTAMPQHAIGATVRSVARTSGSRWMLLDVFEGSPAASAGLAPGYFLIEVDGQPALPPTFPTFRFGQEQRVIIETPEGKRSMVLRVPRRRARGRRFPLVEPKSPTYRVVRDVGILGIPFFPGAFGIRFSSVLDSAVESLKRQGCDKLIIDLRGCLGGSLGFARLASYLCPGKIPIGYSVTRKRLRSSYHVEELPRVAMPHSTMELFLCLGRFSIRDKSLMLLTQGMGKQPFHGRIVVLVNEWTNSAGEMAAQFAKDMELATIVGRATNGNVLGSMVFKVGSGYELYLPIFGWYSPNGKHTEGAGVQPDIPIDIDPDRLAHGDDAQLNKALELLH
jgi:carboxyl-terminal processing protease